jgi:AcrR family transcriptional regulator
MGRWEPDARGRLREAAMELYSKRGFEQTTVAEIATRAGLTERTFFRHFADKREVLFRGAEELERHMVQALEALPNSLSPIDAIGRAIEDLAGFFTERPAYYRRRAAIIAANPDLQERERNKLASLAFALAAALRRRGVKDSAATLAAEMGVAVFKIAFEHWIDKTNRQDFAENIRQSLNELKAVSAGATPDARPAAKPRTRR